MTTDICFLHTSSLHIATFDQLLAAEAAEVKVRHLVDESLLAMAITEGLGASLRAQVAERVLDAAADCRVVLCTCSTIGGLAEQAGVEADKAVIRVDRSLAKEALRRGSKIVMVAALGSTLAPTRALLEDAAGQANKSIDIIESLCTRAWRFFEAGNVAVYHSVIAEHLYEAAKLGDVLLLAQASMAPAAELCPDLPVLSSPRLGLRAALAAAQMAEPS